MDVAARIVEGERGAPLHVLLAHGAGAGMETPFLSRVAAHLVATGHRVTRFEFPYMRRRREEGTRRPPDGEAILRRAFLEEAGHAAAEGSPLVLAGKSMGGRYATMVAAEAAPRGVFCLGYPFHPPGRPERLRIDHLPSLTVPTRLVQGSRDPFGARQEIALLDLGPAVEVVWIDGAGHSLERPRRLGGDGLDEALTAVDAFLRGLAGG